jgi:hypothetical protein
VHAPFRPISLPQIQTRSTLFLEARHLIYSRRPPIQTSVTRALSPRKPFSRATSCILESHIMNPCFYPHRNATISSLRVYLFFLAVKPPYPWSLMFNSPGRISFIIEFAIRSMTSFPLFIIRQCILSRRFILHLSRPALSPLVTFFSLLRYRIHREMSLIEDLGSEAYHYQKKGYHWTANLVVRALSISPRLTFHIVGSTSTDIHIHNSLLSLVLSFCMQRILLLQLAIPLSHANTRLSEVSVVIKGYFKQS